MKTSTRRPTTALLGALLGVSLALFLVWRFLAPEVATDARGATVETRDDERAKPREPGQREISSTPDVGERVAAPATSAGDAPAPALTATAAPATRFHVRGRVLDVVGNPVPAVGVALDGADSVLASSDAFGIFEVDLEPRSQKLVARSDEWVTVRYDSVHPSMPAWEHFLIVARPIALAGRVADSGGRPIAGAKVAVDLSLAVFADFPLPLDWTGVVAPSTKTREDGTFAVDRVPALVRASLRTTSAGFADDRRPLPADSVSDLLIELHPPEVTGAFLEGVVVHSDGKPAAGAHVHLVDREATTDLHGSFRLEVESVEPDTPLVAVLAGFQPGVIPEYGRVIAANDGHPPPARLVLGPPPLSIEGHVLEADGRACNGWTVSIQAGTEVSQFQIPAVTAEGLTAGEGGNEASTDSDGHFVLEGLRDMPYLVQAYARDGRMIRSAPIPAGTKDVVLRCEPDALIERIHGRVLARDGTPIAGATVSVALVTYETSYGSQWLSVKDTTTGADGSFELDGVPRRYTQLNAAGPDILGVSLLVAKIELDQPIEFVVVRTCRFRFESAPEDDAPTSLAVLDAEGKPLLVTTKQAGSSMSSMRAKLVDGRSHVLAVSEDASRLVLYKDQEILASQPLRLVPGEIATVRRAR